MNNPGEVDDLEAVKAFDTLVGAQMRKAQTITLKGCCRVELVRRHVHGDIAPRDEKRRRHGRSWRFPWHERLENERLQPAR